MKLTSYLLILSLMAITMLCVWFLVQVSKLRNSVQKRSLSHNNSVNETRAMIQETNSHLLSIDPVKLNTVSVNFTKKG
jgi:hypothetical protein